MKFFEKIKAQYNEFTPEKKKVFVIGSIVAVIAFIAMFADW